MRFFPLRIRFIGLLTVATSVACASVSPPPTVSADAPYYQRRKVYATYRLYPDEPGMVRRDAEAFDIDQFGSLTANCPAAEEMIERPSVVPYFVGGLGAVGFGLGVARLVLGTNDRTRDDLPWSTEAAWGMIGGGVALGALAYMLDILLAPEPEDSKAFADAYNACLRRDLKAGPRDLDDPRAPPMMPSGKEETDWRDAANQQDEGDAPIRTRTATTPVERAPEYRLDN